MPTTHLLLLSLVNFAMPKPPPPLPTVAFFLLVLVLLLGMVAGEGGGEVASTERCTICPSGFTVQFNNAPFAMEDTASRPSTPTCAEADAALTEEVTPEMCPSIRLDFLLDYPSACGYCVGPPDSAGVCTLCADGSVPARDVDFDPGFGFSCGQLAYAAMDFDSGTANCTDVQALGYACGCPPPEGGLRCEVCPGGVPDPAKVPVALSDDGTTCGDIVAQAPIFAADDEICVQISAISAAECGCTPVHTDDVCDVCPGGVPDPSKLSDTVNATCLDLAYWASFSPRDSEECSSLNFVAAVDCGCDLPPLADLCTLCADGSAVPEKDLLLDPGDPGSTCSFFELVAATAPTGANDADGGEGGSCAAFQATAGAACGCADPPAPACDPKCPAGSDFGFTRKVEDVVLSPEEGRGGGDDEAAEMILCGQVLWELSTKKEDCTEERKVALRERCCVGTSANETDDVSEAGAAPSEGGDDNNLTLTANNETSSNVESVDGTTGKDAAPSEGGDGNNLALTANNETSSIVESVDGTTGKDASVGESASRDGGTDGNDNVETADSTSVVLTPKSSVVGSPSLGFITHAAAVFFASVAVVI